MSMMNVLQNIRQISLSLALVAALLTSAVGAFAVATEPAEAWQWKTCEIWVSSEEVTFGGDVTVYWSTSGFTEVRINGELVDETSGQKVYENIQDDITFSLEATDGEGSTCTADVDVICIVPPPPGQCELDITKQVNRATAEPGDTLTYTITVENIGDADCTGGVKIIDRVHSELTYQSYSTSQNISPGYGEHSVYTAHDRTLRFDAQVLTPGESGTIEWTGEVKNPSQCGDFKVTNQAQVTAQELNHFDTWVYSERVETHIDNECVVNPPECTLTPETQTIDEGERATLTWTTQYADEVTLTDFDQVSRNDSVTTDPLFANKQYVLTATGPDGTVSCEAEVIVQSTPDPLPVCVEFIATPATIMTGASSTLSWESQHAVSASISDIGSVDVNGERVVAPADTTNYVLTLTGGGGDTVECDTTVTVTPTPQPPTCDLFEAVPDTVQEGESVELRWETSNAVSVEIDQGIGGVATDGERTVSPDVTTLYTLTATGVAGTNPVTCDTEVEVIPDTVPQCTLAADPSDLSAGGGLVDLEWEVTNATDVSISPNVGAVALTGTTSELVTQSTNFVLTATDADGDEVQCEAPVTVADQQPLSCANNVEFRATDRTIDEGDSTTLIWSTNDVDSVSISRIAATSLSGDRTVSPRSDTTYVLTATRGTESVDCPLTINVDEDNGGGGGSASPRCELEISDDEINRGDSITLTWETSRATRVFLEDDRGNTIFTTDDYLGDDKEEYFDGSIDLKPTRDTEYTLLAERGRRDDECVVDVEVNDPVTVTSTRDREPLVAGIALSQVPYTGFEAGPIMTFLFYTLLVAWSLYLTYILVIRKRLQAVGAPAVDITAEEDMSGMSAMARAEATLPDLFPAADYSPQAYSTATTSTDAPHNLPTGEVSGTTASTVIPAPTSAPAANPLEERAHAQYALLSSDALARLETVEADEEARLSLLDEIIAEAKRSYPLEDGWIVINDARMKQLCAVCHADTPAAPVAGSTGTTRESSLAEAIVTGNVLAAYELIGNRPMFSLADAAADLDALVRQRRGESVAVSSLLQSATSELSDAQLQRMITALTGAIDGTYTDEAAAVKMAIMKAVKEVA
ncbi:MAG: hypothetical protein ACOC4E_00270 [Patescibacteria group bacterium]